MKIIYLLFFKKNQEYLTSDWYNSNYSVHHSGLPLSKTGNNISISALQIRQKVEH